MQFSPIHDIPLGLDSDGMLRAPAYNVGQINNDLFGTVYKDHNASQALKARVGQVSGTTITAL